METISIFCAKYKTKILWTQRSRLCWLEACRSLCHIASAAEQNSGGLHVWLQLHRQGHQGLAKTDKKYPSTIHSQPSMLACELLKHYNIHDESQAVLCSLLCCHSRGLKKLATRGSATRPINNLYNFLEKTSRSEAKCSSRKIAEKTLCAKITKLTQYFSM